jgi:ankyrin repeat protein
MVFNELDDQSLTQVKMSNREICQYLEEERFYWVRVLKSFKGRVVEFNESWKKVVNKAPVEIIQQFAIACHNFFKHYPAGDWSPLHISAESGQLSLFQMTYEKTGKSKPLTVWTIDNWTVRLTPLHIAELTPLHIAAGAGQLEICQLIMDDLDDKNPGDPNGYTPLHHAARRGSVEGCNFIMDKLENKSPIFYPGRLNATPLCHAVIGGHLEVCRFILENGGTGDLDTLLGRAARIGYLDICILIMERLENKNPRLMNGHTPFHVAAIVGKLEICKAFLKLLAEKNPSDDQGFTPLHHAAKNGFLEICQLISSEIQDKNPVNDRGMTPLAYAIEKNHQDVVDFLSS